MELSDVACRNAKATAKPRKLSDGKGLYLYVAPNGSKLWRCDYAFAGKRRTASFGAYPETSLAQARVARDELKAALRAGRDPAVKQEDARPTFEAVARDWYKVKAPGWKTSYGRRIWKRIEDDILPSLGSKAIADIKPGAVLEPLQAIEGRDANYTARRIHQMVRSIFEYAVAKEHIEINPATSLGVVLKPVPKGKHRAALKESELPEFFARLANTPMDEMTRVGLKAIAHVFVRTDELRFAKWTEFDFQQDVWTIPAPRMKMKRELRVPLSRQAKAIFQRLKELAGESEWVLPGPRTGKPISENTLLYALYRIGLHSRATVHGFRATFSTIANESELWDRDAIEHQLAHAPDDAIRAAYDRGERWQSRVRMMQWYSDLLDKHEAAGLKHDLAHMLD
jgi:integrase